MKSILNLVAICFTVALIGCSTTPNTAVSPGAISECAAKEGMACTKAKEECCGADKCAGEAASMGAVRECATKADCASKCAAKCEAGAAMGAVSECATKADCASKCATK